MGGVSAEHAISLRSARAVITALGELRHTVIPTAVTKSGQWLAGDMRDLLGRADGELLEVPADAGRPVVAAPAVSGGRLLSLDGGEGAGDEFDIALPVLHGPGGEDGTVQGLFETLGIPFVGAGSAASAMAMDKLAMKTLAAGAGIEQVEFMAAGNDDAAALAARIESAFGFPCFVKPALLGSSVGISKVDRRQDLAAALSQARRWGRRVIVERAVRAREIELSMLGGAVPEIAPAGEIVPKASFYDFEDKYVNSGAGLLVPAELEQATAERLEDVARRVWDLIGCSGMLRVDFFVEAGRVLLNEANTIPGFTAISMYPRSWKTAGVEMPELLTRLIDIAIARDAT